MNKKGIVAVDIGTGMIKVLAVSFEKGFQVENCAEIPTAGFDRASLTDVHALAKAVKQGIECSQFATDISSYPIYLGIGGMGISSITGNGSIALESDSSIGDAEIDRVCRAAILSSVPDDLRALHVLPREFRLDQQKVSEPPLNRQGNCLEVLAHIVTMPIDAYVQLLGALNKVGINVAGVYANTIAGIKWLKEKADARGFLYLDIGEEIIDAAICCDGNTVWSASIPLGGGYITRDIMISLDVDCDQAKAVKRHYTRLSQTEDTTAASVDIGNGNVVEYKFLHNVVASRVNEIAKILADHIQPELTTRAVSKIYVTGGCVNVPVIAESVHQYFNLPVSRISPELPSEYAGYSNSACYGIAIDAIKRYSITIETEKSPSSLWNELVFKFTKIFKK